MLPRVKDSYYQILPSIITCSNAVAFMSEQVCGREECGEETVSAMDLHKVHCLKFQSHCYSVVLGWDTSYSSAERHAYGCKGAIRLSVLVQLPDYTSSGIAKAGPGRAHARLIKAPCSSRSCHTISHKARASARANGLAYSRCLANTNDLATPLYTSAATAKDKIWSI